MAPATSARQRRPTLPSSSSDQSLLDRSSYSKYDKANKDDKIDDGRGLGWLLPVLALGILRHMSASSNIVHDCDEVFNYWEPLHYVLYKSGFQTWEYRYIETYKQPIEMLPSKEEWMKVNLPYEVGPPHTKRPRGRPKKVRMRGEDEHGKNKTSKQQHQCQRCGGWGHHRNTCKNPINSQIVIQGAKRGRGRGRGRGRERQESILQTSEGIDYDAPIGETSEEPIQNTVEVRGSRRARGGVRGRGRSSTMVEGGPSGQVEGVSSQLQLSDFDWDFDFLLDGTSSATIPEPPVGSVDTTSTFMNSWDISNYQITSISPNEATSPLKTKTKRKPLRGGKK